MPLPFTDLLQSIAARFRPYERWPAPSLPTTAEIGSYGERVAASFLRQKGYRVLYRNFKTERGEIDLVCRHGNVLAFVEVRTRSGIEFGQPVESIGEDKQESLRYAALRYLQMLERDDIFHRFDAVEIVLKPGKIPQCTLHTDLFS